MSEREALEAKYHNRWIDNRNWGNLISNRAVKTDTFTGLFRYKEAFSVPFVQRIFEAMEVSKSDYVFDPFAGMGTTLFTAMQRGIPSIGMDALPLPLFIASVLPKFWSLSPGELQAAFDEVYASIDKFGPATIADDVPIMRKAFDVDTLDRLRQWKSALDSGLVSPEVSEPLKLLLLSILEDCSYARKDGAFLRIVGSPLLTPDVAMRRKVAEAEWEIGWFGETPAFEHKPTLFRGDARGGWRFEPKPTVLITSPPYANRYDYTRNYILELCFEFVKDAKELKALRHSILRSFVDVQFYASDVSAHPALTETLNALSDDKLNNKRVPGMLTAYFVDMEAVICEWYALLADKARLALVVDNVCFAGEVVPVDLILADILERWGFDVKEMRLVRYKGNSPQQMAKYGRQAVRESVIVAHKT